MLAHQFAGAVHRFDAEVLPQLADELRAQQLNMLLALDFDAFDLSVGLRAQMFGDALSVGARFLDDCLRLPFGLTQRLLMGLGGRHEPFRGGRVVLELFANRLLAVGHQLAHRRNDVAPHQPHDQREPNQLADERRHELPPRRRGLRGGCAPDVDTHHTAGQCHGQRLHRRLQVGGYRVGLLLELLTCLAAEPTPTPRRRDLFMSSRILRPSARASSRIVDASRRARAIAAS